MLDRTKLEGFGKLIKRAKIFCDWLQLIKVIVNISNEYCSTVGCCGAIILSNVVTENVVSLFNKKIYKISFLLFNNLFWL